METATLSTTMVGDMTLAYRELGSGPPARLSTAADVLASCGAT